MNVFGLARMSFAAPGRSHVSTTRAFALCARKDSPRRAGELVDDELADVVAGELVARAGVAEPDDQPRLCHVIHPARAARRRPERARGRGIRTPSPS